MKHASYEFVKFIASEILSLLSFNFFYLEFRGTWNLLLETRSFYLELGKLLRKFVFLSLFLQFFYSEFGRTWNSERKTLYSKLGRAPKIKISSFFFFLFKYLV